MNWESTEEPFFITLEKYKEKYKNDRKISIIVSVYNVENYLRQCLDSILNQTYQDLGKNCAALRYCSPSSRTL